MVFHNAFSNHNVIILDTLKIYDGHTLHEDMKGMQKPRITHDLIVVEHVIWRNMYDVNNIIVELALVIVVIECLFIYYCTFKL